jgi:NitT/TauT family transport system permease protein
MTPRDSLQSVVAPALGVCVFFGAWELLVRVNDIRPYKLSAPSRILTHMADDPAFYLRNAWVTGREAAIGFHLALLIALVIGAVLAHSRFLEQATHPVAVLIQVTPFVAYAPAIALWTGGGWKTIELITCIVCIVPFLFATVSGLRSADPAVIEVLRSVHASPFEVLWRVRLPSALPQIFTAARICVGLALIGAYLAEGYALVSEGLGTAGKRAAAFNDADQLWGSVFATAALGVTGLAGIVLLERIALRWHASQRTDSSRDAWNITGTVEEQ